MRLLFFLFIAGLQFIAGIASYAQSEMTLQDCIDYTLDNNIQLQQNDMRNKELAVRLTIAKNERMPAVNTNFSNTVYFGRGPTRDGTYQDRTQVNSSAGASLNMNLFNGLRISHNIDLQRLNLATSFKDSERIKNDLTIDIISCYLQILMCEELLHNVSRQLEISNDILKRTNIFFDLGKITIADVAESESMNAKSKLLLVQCENNLKAAYMELKHIMCYPVDDSISIKRPMTNLEDSYNSVPEVDNVYNYIIDNNPQIHAYECREEASKASIAIAKSARYPSLTLSMGYSNNYYYSFIDGYVNRNFTTQLQNNGSEYVGLSLNFPIFNKFNGYNQIKLANINHSQAKLSLLEVKRSLHKEIERLNLDIMSSYEKYISAGIHVNSMNMVLENERKKYELQKTPLYRYNEVVQTLEQARSEMLQAKYEYLFKIKILNFYYGQSIEFDYID